MRELQLAGGDACSGADLEGARETKPMICRRPCSRALWTKNASSMLQKTCKMGRSTYAFRLEARCAERWKELSPKSDRWVKPLAVALQFSRVSFSKAYS